MSSRAVLSAALALGMLACGPSARVAPAAPPSPAEWRQARARLAAKRDEVAGPPRTMKLTLELREPVTGRVMRARGAVALAPPRSLRMVLVGPGGTTALDLWAHDGAFRFSVPALDLLRRGDRTTPRASMRGMPIDFLEWWLLRPFDGKIVDCRRREGLDHYVLRDGAAIIELTLREDGSLEARRSTFAVDEPGERPRRVDEETISADGLGCGVVRYDQASTRLSITVTCESVERERAPDPRAFVDPDEARP